MIGYIVVVGFSCLPSWLKNVTLSLSPVVNIVYSCFVIMYCCNLICYLYTTVLTKVTKNKDR